MIELQELCKVYAQGDSEIAGLDGVSLRAERGRVAPTEYPPGTLRERLFGAGPRLPDRHPGASYRRLGELAGAAAAA